MRLFLINMPFRFWFFGLFALFVSFLLLSPKLTAVKIEQEISWVAHRNRCTTASKKAPFLYELARGHLAKIFRIPLACAYISLQYIVRKLMMRATEFASSAHSILIFKGHTTKPVIFRLM